MNNEFLFREKDDDYWDTKSRYLNLNYGEVPRKSDKSNSEESNSTKNKYYNDYKQNLNYDEEFIFNDESNEPENQNEELIEFD